MDPIQRSPHTEKPSLDSRAVKAVPNRHIHIIKAPLVARRHFNKSFDPGAHCALYLAAVFFSYADTYWSLFELTAVNAGKLMLMYGGSVGAFL